MGALVRIFDVRIVLADATMRAIHGTGELRRMTQYSLAWPMVPHPAKPG